MARNEETKRVQFTLPAALVDAIDEVCERSRMQRSTWVEYTLANAITAQAQFMSGLVSGISEKMVETAGELVDGAGE